MCRILIRRRTAWMPKAWMWIAAFAAMSSGNVATAATTVLDFEDITAGTTITTQYGPRGVLFEQAYLDVDPNAHSGTRVLRTWDPGVENFSPSPLVMTFTAPHVTRVKLFAAHPAVLGGTTVNGTLTVFDANGAVLFVDGPKLVALDVFTTVFEATVTTASITRAELQLEGVVNQAIDDLEFDGEPPVVPTEAPVVQILTPANGTEQDLTELDVTGTVTGEGLLSAATLTAEYRQPPESTAPPFMSAVNLTGSGTTRQFALPISGPNIWLGPITITVTAENTGGLKGTGTSTFNNLPAAIRDRFNADGGAATYGAFRFGLFQDVCKIAVYERGAISTNGSVIRGDILAKWLTLRGPSNETGWFGCPLGEERDAVGAAPAPRSSCGGASTPTCPEPRRREPPTCSPCSCRRSTSAAASWPTACPSPIPPIRSGRCRRGCSSNSLGRAKRSCPLRWRSGVRPPRCGWNVRAGLGSCQSSNPRCSTKPCTDSQPPSGRASPAATIWGPARWRTSRRFHPKTSPTPGPSLWRHHL